MFITYSLNNGQYHLESHIKNKLFKLQIKRILLIIHLSVISNVQILIVLQIQLVRLFLLKEIKLRSMMIQENPMNFNQVLVPESVDLGNLFLKQEAELLGKDH